jgi:hypothetical protein
MRWWAIRAVFNGGLLLAPPKPTGFETRNGLRMPAGKQRQAGALALGIGVGLLGIGG